SSSSTLVPYTTLFRSKHREQVVDELVVALAPIRQAELAAHPLREVPVVAVGEGAQALLRDLDRGVRVVREQRQQRLGEPGEVPRSEEHTSELQSRENL